MAKQKNHDGSESPFLKDLSEVSGDSAEAEVSIGNITSLSIGATVSISSGGLSSLALCRAQTIDTSGSDILVVNQGYILPRESIFRPLSDAEQEKIDDLVQQVARYSKLGDFETMKVMEKLLRDARRRSLFAPVADELLAEPVFDEKTGERDRDNAGGPLSRGLDVYYTWEEGGETKKKLLIGRDGAIASFVRQKSALVDRANLVVENRKRRFTGDKNAQRLTRAMVGHESTVISDQPEFVQFHNNPETGAQEVDMNIPVHFSDLQAIANDAKKTLGLSDSEARDSALTITG